MKNWLYNRYYPKKSPISFKYGGKSYKWNSKLGKRQFLTWINETYPTTYKDVKEGDCFILYNGESRPVPFIQLKDEKPDPKNRPTRLLDGSYLTISPNNRVAIVSKEVVINLKKEINEN